MDCIFCKIANGEINTKKIYEDNDMIAFYDIEKKAPIHFLVIPKNHIENIDDLDEKNYEIVGKIFLKIKTIASELGIEDGYRVVTNCKEKAGQTVMHLHFHVLAGRDFSWPPG